MSAIILTRHTPTRPKPTRMSTKQLTPQLRTTERTPLLNSKDRTTPLKDTLSTTRFVTICIGIFSANFVFAFQTTSMPTLMSGISSGYGHAELGSYLGSVFTLANTAVIPVYGVLMESLGRKVAMLTAGIFYGLGTILCATSGSMYQLIAARAVAGLGGGGLLTVSSVIVTDLVPLRDRGVYQGIMMTVFGAGTMIGGPLAGWLSDHHGWQWSFWVQMPIIIFTLIITTLFLPPSPIPPTHPTLLSGLTSLDWTGTILLISSVTALILGFSFHTSYLIPWSSPTVWGLLLASILAFGLFVFQEKRAGEGAVVNLKNLRSKHRSAIMASGFLLSAANGAFMFYIPVYFTVVVNTSTSRAGMINSICGGLGLATGSLLAGQYIRNGNPYKILGTIALLAPMIGAFVASLWTPNWSTWSYYATVLPMTFGYSVFLCCQLVALVSGVDSKAMPKATALLYTIRALGGTIGISSAGSIQLSSLTHSLRNVFKHESNASQMIDAILHSKSAIRELPPHLEQAAIDAYAHSLSAVWVVAGGVAALTVVASLFIQEKDVGTKGEETGGGVVGDGGEGLGGGTVVGRGH